MMNDTGGPGMEFLAACRQGDIEDARECLVRGATRTTEMRLGAPLL